MREVARRFSVSPATVSRWSCRWRAASEQERALARLPVRPLEPAAADAAPAAGARAAADLRGARADRLGAAPADRAHRPPALDDLEGARSGTGSRGRRGRRASPRAATSGPAPATCCTWTSRSTHASSGPATPLTGDRSSTAAEKRARVGYDYAHAIVDDHSRLAYAELLADERAATVTAFVERALAFFAAHGIEAEAADDRQRLELHASNRSLRELLAARGIRHLTTPQRRPRTNGKVERFHQTMAREWAYGLRYRSSRHRAAALPHWLRYYNERRPHSSLGGLPPISRVHNVCGQDS